MSHTTHHHGGPGPGLVLDPLPPFVGQPAIRKDAGSAFGFQDQMAFKNAVQQLVADGTYAMLVEHHMDMSHNMHINMGPVGLHRFLGWHRRYLVAFERELQRVDAVLRPGAIKLGIPYWRWQDGFPPWMNGFLPANIPPLGQLHPPPRDNAGPPNLPNDNDVDIILNHFSIQRPGIPGQNDYTKFTVGIGGRGIRPNGTKLPAHDQVHSWVGGIMGNLMKSPTDPIFWLHHAEVDRLWEIWRQANPAPGPLLAGAERIMDPWAESYDDLLNIGALGYVYGSLAP